MNKKLFYVSIFLILILLFSGCVGVTPDSDQVGGDFYLCENLLKAYYTALSNRDYTQALSYCKPGGVMFKFANSMWDLAIDYPTLYHTYEIYEVYNFSFITSLMISCKYDFSSTQRDIYGGIYDTNYYYGYTGLFEKVNGEWKLG